MGTADSTSCNECVRIPVREYLTTLLLVIVITSAVAFAIGYYQGMQIPREPTFGEKVYHNNAEKSKAAKLLRACREK